jgi:hypothetical protein
VRSGADDQALIDQMPDIAKAAKSFHFDRSAYLALHLLCPPELRNTRVVIQGDKINAMFAAEPRPAGTGVAGGA